MFEFLTAAQAAERLKTTPAAVRKRVERGTLAGVNIERELVIVWHPAPELASALVGILESTDHATHVDLASAILSRLARPGERLVAAVELVEQLDRRSLTSLAVRVGQRQRAGVGNGAAA